MDPRVLLIVASGGEHPLIDIDTSVLVQFGIFMCTMAVATQLLFKPYLAMRERRHAGIEGARDDASRMSAEADGKLVDYEQKIASARARATQERNRIRGEAAKHQSEVTNKAREEAAQAAAKAHETVAYEIEKARSELLPKADDIGRQIAEKLLGREVA